MTSKRFGGPEWFLLLSGIALGVYIFVLMPLPSFVSFTEGLWNTATQFSERNGYLGAFLVSALGNTTIVIPFPYTAFIVLLGGLGLNPFLLGLIAGIGASIGESTSYILGLLGRQAVRKKYGANLHRLRQLIDRRPRFVLFLLFLIGFTPIPDDPFLISFGLLRYNVLRAIIPFSIGKIILTTIFALAGRYALSPESLTAIDQGNPFVTILTLAGTIIIIYAVLKVDWQRFSERLLGGHDGRDHCP